MKKLLWAIIAMAGLATACQKDPDDLSCPQAGPATFEGLTKRHSPPVQVFEFDPAVYQEIQTAGGGRVSIAPNIFIRPDGSLPTGRVKLLFQEIYSPAEMILANRPTMGVYTSNSIRALPLESGGEFNIRVIDGNTRLRLTPGGQRYGIYLRTRVPARVSQDSRNRMSLWASRSLGGSADSAVWQQVQLAPDSVGPAVDSVRIFLTQFDTVNVQGGFTTTQWPDTLGWLNCDAYPFAFTNTTVSVAVGDLRDDPRTQGFRIYLVPALLNGAFRPYWNPTTFQAQQTGIPIGTDLTAVVLRIKDNKYFIGTQRALITDGFVFQPVLEEVTEDELVRRLQQL
jgi:hypothetical protein